ncbi:MAG: glycosyltransferase family 9 protein [Gaiellales bacterium]
MRPRLIVLRALGLGDLLTAVPALRGLRRRFPRHRIILCAPRHLEPVALLAGAVDELRDTRPLAPLDHSLHHADVAVNLHGSGPESHRVLLRRQPGRLIAFWNSKLTCTSGAPLWRPDEHEVARWSRMLSEQGVPVDPTDLHLQLDVDPTLDVETTIVHPGAASESRRWPADRFAAIARHQLAIGRTVIVTGTRAERRLAAKVASLADIDPSAVLAGRTTLPELILQMARAGRVVCGDTGIAHLATALGTPSVVLFGPTSPAHWGPPPDPRHRVLWHGSTGDPHADRQDAGLLQISVDEVLEALRECDDHSRRRFTSGRHAPDRR